MPSNTTSPTDQTPGQPAAPALENTQPQPAQPVQPAQPASPATPAAQIAPAPVTPKQPAPAQGAGKMGFGPAHHNNILRIAVLGVALIIAIVLIYHLYGGSTQQTATTSVPVVAYNINSCTTITSPGTYHVIGDISTSIDNGSCISVNSANVRLIGEGHKITGNGPFVDTAPYSRGIEVSSQSNVSISGLTLAKFSYGIVLYNSNHLDLSNITVQNSTITGLSLNRSSDNNFHAINVSGSTGTQGGIYVLMSDNNTFSSSASQYNSYYGIIFSNSTGNKVYNGLVIGNPVDFSCNYNSTLRSANKMLNTTCYVNDQCNFAYCSEVNTQAGVGSVHLYAGSINKCGTISQGGSYTLTNNLNLTDYLNTSIGQNINSPCISVNASDVYLNCNGHTIYNAPYGISAAGQYNVTIDNCNVQSSKYGVYLDGVVKFRLSSIGAYGSNYGVFIANSTNGNLTGITSSHNRFGIYLNGTVYTMLSGLNVQGNTYGILTDNSSSVRFGGGSVSSNSKSDFYCTPSTYNSSSITMSGTSCTSTDCNWASSCPVKTLPILSQYPVGSCRTIASSGTYGLTGNIITSSTCFDIMVSNVTVDCNGHSVTGSGSNAAFRMSGVNNVNVTNCRIAQFQYGVQASGGNNISVSSTSISTVGAGVALNSTSGSHIHNVTVGRYSSYGFSLNGTTNSIVAEDSAAAVNVGDGFRLYRAINDTLVNDSVNSSNYGFYISMSRGNKIYNNIALANKVQDFYCDAYSSPVLAQMAGRNTGVTKAGCQWLVLTSETVSTAGQKCTLITSPGLVAFGLDEVYPYGSTCFNIRSNSTLSASGTTINCNGHTVLATNGGSFVNVTNTSGVTIENCVLIGFRSPITVSSKVPVSGITIFNNTIADTPGNAIYVDNVKDSRVIDNNMVNDSQAAYLGRFNTSTVSNNTANGTGTGIYVKGSIAVTAENNTVKSATSGLALVDTSEVTLYNNRLTSATDAIMCSGSLTSGSDKGGNICSSNSGCSWITSPQCRP